LIQIPLHGGGVATYQEDHDKQVPASLIKSKLEIIGFQLRKMFLFLNAY
jgi:hypothetical protein